MIHQSSSWLGTAVSTEHANLPRSDLPQGASARVAATTQTDQAVSQAIVPGPQPDASQPRDHSDAIAAGGGLTQAAAAAVAHIRRRRAASTSSRAQDWDTVHACPAVHSQSSPPVAQPLLDDATNMRSAARNARQQTDVAAAAGDGVPRSLDHDDLAAGVRQADELQHVQGRSQLPASASLPVADKAQRSQRPPLPSHSIRRSARLHKPANASPSGADKGSAADADAVVQSPHTSSAQGNIAASSPVQR